MKLAYQSYKPAATQDNAMKLAFTQELSTKIKRYDMQDPGKEHYDINLKHDIGDEVKTSTFKPRISYY
jgi:hypothetical protein